MLISHKHHFIFVHIYKNAGTSIVNALLPFATSNKIHLQLIQLAIKQDIHLPKAINPVFLSKHCSASQIIESLGQINFDTYFSFAFVRNPWDWQVSLYNYMRKDKQHPQHAMVMNFKSFDEYIHWRCGNEIRLQKSFIFSADDQLQVDFIGRYENLEPDFASICQRIGIQASLPRLNVSKTRPYQSYYNAETIELVRSAFLPDIQAFQYDFE